VEEEGTAEVFKNTNEMENVNDMEVELPAVVTQRGWKKVLLREYKNEREAILQARNHLVIFRFEQEQKVAAMRIQKQFQVRRNTKQDTKALGQDESLLETPKAANFVLHISKQGNTPSLTSTVFPDKSKLPATDPLRRFLPRPYTETEKKFTNNSRIKHEFMEVIGFKIQLPLSKETEDESRSAIALKNIQKRLRTLFQSLVKADASFTPLPFYETDRRSKCQSELIGKAEHITDNYQELTKYAPELYVNVRKTNMYLKWLVAHRKPFVIIWQNIKHTLVPEGQYMYRRYLQCDDHVFAGTVMYSSHWNLPVDRLCLMLSKFCGCNISARFKALDVGRRDENSPLIRSMHVECSAKDKAKVKQFMEAYYNTQSPRTFMLGIKLRFIPLLYEAVGIGGHDKTMRLYNRQAKFNKMLQWSNIFSLTDAQIIDSRSKHSINDCIVALKCRDTGKQIFHSLDQPFGPGTNYKLSFISAYQAEAQEVLNTLPAYLAHWNGTWVYKYFKSEDVAKARNCYWDQKSRSIQSTKEKMMDDLMMWDTEWYSQV
jgi:hypothetical protein